MTTGTIRTEMVYIKDPRKKMFTTKPGLGETKVVVVSLLRVADARRQDGENGLGLGQAGRVVDFADARLAPTLAHVEPANFFGKLFTHIVPIEFKIDNYNIFHKEKN